MFGDERLSPRFWSKVAINEVSGCWEWTAARGDLGHGVFGSGEVYGTRAAHRIAYMALVGPVGSNLHVHHRCRNPACVNPDHLEPLTPKEHGRHHRDPLRVKRLCKRGHVLSHSDRVVAWRDDILRRHCWSCRQILG